jgi:hypothetical protein
MLVPAAAVRLSGVYCGIEIPEERPPARRMEQHYHFSRSGRTYASKLLEEVRMWRARNRGNAQIGRVLLRLIAATPSLTDMIQGGISNLVWARAYDRIF